MYKTFLIKYAEIAIKGKNRYIFEDALVKNIKYQLRNVDGSFEVRRQTETMIMTRQLPHCQEFLV
jgi:thiamine biosynthesis protein ThiI